MGTQVFIINPDGTTTELTSDGSIKDLLKTDECYVIVADDIRKVFLWKGISSNVRSKFIGAKRSQEIRGQVGMHYAVVPLDEAEETPDFLEIIGGKTEAGIAKEIKEEKAARAIPKGGGGGGGGHPLREKPIFEAPTPAEGMNIAGSMNRSSQNSGPLYTGQQTQDFQQDLSINFDQIMAKLEEIKIPEGYERELIIIGNRAYSVVEKVASFLGEKKIEKVIEEIGTIPDGIFFAESYSPRVLSENGKVLSIEFLKRTGPGTGTAVEFKDKKQILKNQIKAQLQGK